MQAISDTPTFNLKVVLQETGIKPDTIRAWERRYGLPEPKRTGGGHRLYSQRDIEMIKWLMIRQEEGLSISRAVDLWHNIENEGRDPLEDFGFQTPGLVVAPPVEFTVGSALEDIRRAWVEACLAFDEAKAEAILTQAFSLYPVEVVCLAILQKGISQIGQRWYLGQVSVQQEHFASALALRKLNTLISASPAPFQKEKIIVACPPEEDHTFSALLITLFLRQRGWPVIYLGANVPLDELRETIDELKPRLIIMPAQQLSTASNLAEVAREIHFQVTVAFGGLIFNLAPAIRSRIPGFFIGEDLDYVAANIEQLIRQKPSQPKAHPPSPEYQEALAHFRDQQNAIAARTWSILSSNGIERSHLDIATQHLTQDIEAALSLGDLNFLSNEIEWLEQLMANYEIPPIGLRNFLQTYYQSVQEMLDQRGQILVNWLSQLLKSG